MAFEFLSTIRVILTQYVRIVARDKWVNEKLKILSAIYF